MDIFPKTYKWPIVTGKGNSIPLIIRKVQIKAIKWGTYVTFARVTIIKKTEAKCWWGYKKREVLCTMRGNVN
jgi:hypothetical protein